MGLRFQCRVKIYNPIMISRTRCVSSRCPSQLLAVRHGRFRSEAAVLISALMRAGAVTPAWGCQGRACLTANITARHLHVPVALVLGLLIGTAVLAVLMGSEKSSWKIRTPGFNDSQNWTSFFDPSADSDGGVEPPTEFPQPDPSWRGPGRTPGPGPLSGLARSFALVSPSINLRLWVLSSDSMVLLYSHASSMLY